MSEEGERMNLRGPVTPSDTDDAVDVEIDTETVQDRAADAEGVGSQGGSEEADGKNPFTDEYHTRYDRLSERHAEIRKMIQDGLTKRVIHKELGVSRTTIDRYIKAHEDLVEAWNDAQEDILDLSEEVINELTTIDCSMIETENGAFPRLDGRSLATKFNAAKLRLERLGGKRGWNAKIETNEVGNGGRIPVICVGEFSEDELAANKALVDEANRKALEGLDGIPHG